MARQRIVKNLARVARERMAQGALVARTRPRMSSRSSSSR